MEWTSWRECQSDGQWRESVPTCESDNLYTAWENLILKGVYPPIEVHYFVCVDMDLDCNVECHT